MEKNGYAYTRGSYKPGPCNNGNVVNFSDYITFSQSSNDHIYTARKPEASIVDFSDYRDR